MITGMGARERRGFRGGLVRLDPLSEYLASRGGTAACRSCTLVVPTGRLLHGVCPACLRPRPAPGPRVAGQVPVVSEPGAVYVDASWRDGVAGLAVVGALGEHRRVFLCRSNVVAEVEAVSWALRLARGREDEYLLFRTDSVPAARVAGAVCSARRRPLWEAEWVPRRRNRRADQLSREARLSGTTEETT